MSARITSIVHALHQISNIWRRGFIRLLRNSLLKEKTRLLLLRSAVQCTVV